MKTYKQLVAILSIALATLFTACQKNDMSVTPQPEENLTEQNLPFESEPGTGDRETGFIPLSDEEYSKLPSLPEEDEKTSLAKAVSLSCPPVRSQGSEGSCVAWGTAYEAFSIAYRAKHGGTFSTSTNIFSPEFVFNQIKIGSSCSNGAYITDALNLLKSKGVCRWSKMPYSSTNGCSIQPNSSQRADAAKCKISGYSTVTRSASSFKSQLSTYKRPIILGTSVDNNFINLGFNQIYNKYLGPRKGGHCYTVVGYDDTKGAFKVINSWGTGWATSGYGWIKYSAINTTFCKEAYILNL